MSVFLVADKTGRPQWGPGVWWCGGLRPSESCVLPSSEKQSASLAVLQMCFDGRTERTLRPSFRRDYSSKFCNHGARNTKELRNTILLLIPFEETDSIKRSVKSRSLFVLQISFFCFLFKYRTIYFQCPSPSASMTNSLKKTKTKTNIQLCWQSETYRSSSCGWRLYLLARGPDFTWPSCKGLPLGQGRLYG